MATAVRLVLRTPFRQVATAPNKIQTSAQVFFGFAVDTKTLLAAETVSLRLLRCPHRMLQAQHLRIESLQATIPNFPSKSNQIEWMLSQGLCVCVRWREHQCRTLTIITPIPQQRNHLEKFLHW